MPSAVRSRDISLDIIRGYAILAITANHLRGNALELGSDVAFSLTLTQLTLASAAELFVFISGFVLFLARARWVGPSPALPSRGLAAKIARRILDLILAIIAIRVVGAAIVAFAYPAAMDPDWLAPQSYQDMLEDPLGSTAEVVALQHFPNAVDVLQLYVVLLALGAFQLTWLVRREWLAWATSFGLYALVQTTPLGLSFETTGWYYDPLAWQFLFLLGMAAAKHDALRRLDRPFVVAAALLFLAAGSALKLIVEFDLVPYGPLRALSAEDIPWRGKPALEPVRLATALATIIVLRWLVGVVPGWLRAIARVVFVPVGERSLFAYAASCVIVLAGAAAVLGPVHSRAGYAALLIAVLGATWAISTLHGRLAVRG